MDRKFQEAQEAILKGVGFEDSVAYLKSSGVFDHVSTLLMRLAAEKPKNALEVFENLSASVKVSGINFPAPQEAKKFDEARDAQKKSILPIIIKSQQALQQANPNPEVSKDDMKFGPDLLAEAWLLEHAGVQLGSDTVFELQVALRNLARDKNLSEARFFGKVQGTQRDYYVIEYKQDAADEAPAGYDPAGTGVNTHGYFVANSVNGPWVKLPDIGAAHIENARRMRKLLSGNLDAPLTGYPPLAYLPIRPPPPPPGSDGAAAAGGDDADASAAAGDAAQDFAEFQKVNTEKYLLRAQLARIAAATIISPSAAYEQKDDEPMAPVEIVPNFEPSEHTDLSKWLHVRTHIYPNGRTKIPDPENPDTDTGGVAPFRPLADDQAAESGGVNHWAARLTPNLSLDLHPAVMVRSLTWPGAVCVAKGNRHACIYVGNGLRHSTQLFSPPPLPAVQGEYVADAEYAYAPKEDGDAPADASVPAPHPPLNFQKDVSVDPNPPKPKAEEEEQPAAEE